MRKRSSATVHRTAGLERGGSGGARQRGEASFRTDPIVPRFRFEPRERNPVITYPSSLVRLIVPWGSDDQEALRVGSSGLRLGEGGGKGPRPPPPAPPPPKKRRSPPPAVDPPPPQTHSAGGSITERRPPVPQA